MVLAREWSVKVWRGLVGRAWAYLVVVLLCVEVGLDGGLAGVTSLARLAPEGTAVHGGHLAGLQRRCQPLLR